MRVAILHYTKPPVVGGVERVVEEQSQALAALGHEVSVIDRANWPAARSGILGGATDAVIVHNVFTMPFDLEWTRELAQLAEETRSIRWVNWVHDVAAVNPAYCHLGWRETPPRALHVAVSEIRAREWAGVSGLNAEQVEIIPNGIDPARVLSLPARIADLANQSDLWQSNLLLFHPARLVRRKNVELGIQLVDALRAQGVDARLIITGDSDPHQEDGRR